MTLPPEVDKKIRTRLEELLSTCLKLTTTKSYFSTDEISNFYAIKNSFLSILHLIGQNTERFKMLIEDVSRYGDYYSPHEDVHKLLGIILAIKHDYETGLLDSIVNLIEANIVADYLGQAEQLLKEGKPGKFDHVPAAVLAGAVLEDSLRRLCQRQIPPIPTDKPNGDPKTLNPLIDDLKKEGVFNELKAKQLRAWADIRNSAAHGEFGDFKREDVEQMIKGVQNFLADYF